jgi:proteasome lid subunit RPN8/RPN11
LPELRITRDALEVVLAHARRARPQECCGLLLGHGSEILEAVPTANQAPDPERHYAIDPVEHFAQIHRCRRINLRTGDQFAVLGAYHSHPGRGPEPSPEDEAQAFADFVFVIVGMGGTGRGVELRAYVRGADQLESLTFVVS